MKKLLANGKAFWPVLLGVLMLLGACFSPWEATENEAPAQEGSRTITINLAGNSRIIIPPADGALFEHQITVVDVTTELTIAQSPWLPANT